MNFKTTGLLLALLVIVGVVWLFFPRSEPGDEPETPETFSTMDSEQDVLASKPGQDTIVRATVERPGKPTLVFERSPKADDPENMDNWRAIEPLAVPVENYIVNGLISTFVSLRSRAQFEPGAEGAPDEADAGLTPPVVTVTLVDKEDEEYKFEVGRKAAMSSDTYVRVVGEKTIHAATRDLHRDVKKEFNDYRDKKLCLLAAADAVSAEITADGKTFVLTRGENEAWVIDAPIKAYAKKDEVLKLIRKLSGLRAQEFVDDAPASLTSYGLDAPALTLKVTTETRHELPAEEPESETQPTEPQYETITETYAIAIGGFADLKEEQRYARLADQPWVVSVRQSDVKDLVPELAKLRDPQITRVKANDATRLELTADGATTTLEKIDGHWQGSGDLSALETTAVADLLEAFEDLAAIDYVLEPGELSEYGLDQPRAVVTVTAGGTVQPVTIHVGDLTRSARNAYVLHEGQPTVYVVSAAQANRLVVPPLALRSRSIFTGDPQSVRRLEVTHAKSCYALLREDDGWRMTEPADAPVDRESMRVLVGDLCRLRARRVVGKEDYARFGLDDPLVTVRFAVEDVGPMPETAPTTEPTSAPARSLIEHTLSVGRRETVAYCRLDDDPYVFELDETLYRVLTAELIDRKLFVFQPELVVGLTIVGPGGTLELSKEGDEWEYMPDPFVKLMQKKVKDFVKELAALRVESYVEYQDADLAAAGLLSAPVTVSIKHVGGRLDNLKLEQVSPGALPRLAGWIEKKRTFMLRRPDVEKLLRGLDYYLAPASGESPVGGIG